MSVPIPVLSVAIVPIVPIAIPGDPVVDLCREILQPLGMDTDHQFLLFSCQRETVTKVSGCDGLGRITQQNLAESAVDRGSAEQLIESLVFHQYFPFHTYEKQITGLQAAPSSGTSKAPVGSVLVEPKDAPRDRTFSLQHNEFGLCKRAEEIIRISYIVPCSFPLPLE